MKLVRRVVTTAPADAVYAYLSDFANASAWDSGTVSCERIDGDGGVGTTYRNVSRFAGRDIEIIYTVERNAFPVYVVCGRTPTMVGRDTITVSALDHGGSSVNYEADFEFFGIARWLGALMRPLLNGLGDRTAVQLKRELDALV